MKRREAAEYALELLKKAGADKAQVVARSLEKDELNVEVGEISLFRTVISPGLGLKALKGGRMGRSQVNRLDREAVEKAVEEVMALMEASSPDPAYDIGPGARGSFRHGLESPEQDSMYERLEEMTAQVRKAFPRITLRGAHLDFVRGTTTLLNSSGAELESTQGHYDFMAMFSAQDKGKSSSFNYTYGSFLNLGSPLLQCFGLEELLRQSCEQTETKSVPEKFVGDLLLTPHCLEGFLGSYLGQLSDASMIAGTSLFKDKLGQKIASPLLTVASEPQHAGFAQHEFFDGDGFLSQNMPVIVEGELRSFLLSQYGANKTGKPKAKSGGGQLVVGAGNSSLAEMIASTKRGILLCRYSGGRPDERGDFSGVAKNSYYVEDGKIRFPVSETMVSGNLAEVFRNVKAVSRDRINFGASLYPWMQLSGATVSGK